MSSFQCSRSSSFKSPHSRRHPISHIHLTVLLLAMILLALPGRAQTCRVSMGITPDGHRSYMEVFEYDFVNEKPSFPGGDSKLVEFINEHRRYPAKAYQEGVQGRVTCSFVVNTDGAVSHLRVLKSVEESLNREALRILALMPAWIPGRHEGVAVPVRVIWSVPFRK